MHRAPQAGAPQELEGLLHGSFLRGQTLHSIPVACAGTALIQASPGSLPEALPSLSHCLADVAALLPRPVQVRSHKLVMRLQQLPRGCAEAGVQVWLGCCEAGAELCCSPLSPHACTTCCATSLADPLDALRDSLGHMVHCWRALRTAGACHVVSSAGLLTIRLGRLASCRRAPTLALLMLGLRLDWVPHSDSLEA